MTRHPTDPGADAGPTLERLSVEECLQLLASQPVGRVAVATPGEGPVVVPVNFHFDGTAILFRTAATSALDGRGAPISFQVDGFDPLHRTGWSVLVRGIARDAADHELAATSAARPAAPWAGGDRPRWVRLAVTVVSGRRITVAESVVDVRGYL